jgi:hypothetical protein
MVENYFRFQVNWESPFSIEIAALHLINPPNSLTQAITVEQFDSWYNQAFPTLVEALKDSGAGWTRIMIRWMDIEPIAPEPSQPPVYDPNMLKWYDDRLSLVSQAGVKMIAIINFPPAWANSENLGCPPITSDHLGDYQQFLTDIVTRYSQAPYNIHTWEIFNEADACFGQSGSLYSEVLENSYSAIKTVDPNATVLMSGIAYDAFTDYGLPFNRYFPDDVMLSGGASFFDVFNFHYFPDYHLEWERWNPPAQPPTCSRPPEDPGYASYDGSGIDLIAKKNHFTNRMSTCFNVNKPVWLTEMAEHGIAGDQKSLRNQAYYVIKGYSRGLAAGIKNITWFALADAGDGENQSLLYPDLTPKPAFDAYKTMVSQLTEFKYDRTILSNFSVDYETGAYDYDNEAYVFKNSNNEEKIVAWGNDYLLNITPATSLTVTDYLGYVSTIQDGSPGDLDGNLNDSIRIKLLVDRASGTVPAVPIPVYIRVTSP